MFSLDLCGAVGPVLNQTCCHEWRHGTQALQAQTDPLSCGRLPEHSEVKDALSAVVDAGGNGAPALDMWATLVNRDGQVCVVAFTGDDRGDQWPGSRVISAQKANTANAFSLPGLALSTANLFSAVQPGGAACLDCNTVIRLIQERPIADFPAPTGRPTTPWWAARSAA